MFYQFYTYGFIGWQNKVLLLRKFLRLEVAYAICCHVLVILHSRVFA